MVGARTLLPTGLGYGTKARSLIGTQECFPLAGLDDISFSHVSVWGGAEEDLRTLTAAQCAEEFPEHFAKLVHKRPSFAGLQRPRGNIMGILNITPDSFSDGGLHEDLDRALLSLQNMHEAGVDVVDIGGESTRPGAVCLDPQEEWGRIHKVVEAAVAFGMCVSVDTRKADVMERALDAGAHIINDVSALTFDKRALDVVASSDAHVVLMHHRGTPQTMQSLTSYIDIIPQMLAFFQERLGVCQSGGIDMHRVMIDPGLGFAKTRAHNYAIMSGLAAFHGLGVPVLLGASRKSMFQSLPFAHEMNGRLPASLSACHEGLRQGMHMIRVHDWQESLQVRAMLDTMDAMNPWGVHT